jgi:hypothetical protein
MPKHTHKLKLLGGIYIRNKQLLLNFGLSPKLLLFCCVCISFLGGGAGGAGFLPFSKPVLLNLFVVLLLFNCVFD